jgi:RNA polymerase sigma-70 factor, ECF subfamily
MSMPGMFATGYQDNIETVSFLYETNTIGFKTVAVADGPFSDVEICERLRRGDQSALRALMERHGPMVLRLAMNVLSDREEAEDVAQEVFLCVWNNRESWINGEAKFSTWLHRVSINRAIDKRRRRRQTPESAEFISAIMDAESAVAGDLEQECQLNQLELSRRMASEIERLPENQARALRGYYFENQDVPAIARAMDTTEQAVRSLLKRGKQALRTRLTRQKKASAYDAFAVQGSAHPVRAGRR